MRLGNQPIDGGNYLFTEEEKNEFLKKEPQAEKWFRAWIGSDEFINRYYRYFLFLKDCPPAELRSMPEAMKRVENVRQFRLASKRSVTRELAERPRDFAFSNISDSAFIVVPETSSERRKFIPIGFLTPDVLASNLSLSQNSISFRTGSGKNGLAPVFANKFKEAVPKLKFWDSLTW